MKHQHLRTLQALYRHPLSHALAMADVEAMLRSLGVGLEPLDGHRLALRLPNGDITWIHAAASLRHPLLDEEGVLRLRRFLQRNGITPEHPDLPAVAPRGDQALRLLIRLDHSGADLWRLEPGSMQQWALHPHGLWSTGQRLTHRHDRDLAGQRAPLDFAYLQELSAAIAEAEAVLLVSHGTGQSSMGRLLLEHLHQHHGRLAQRVQLLEGVDDSACTPAQLLALARAHFGNLPDRHGVAIDSVSERDEGIDLLRDQPGL